MTPTIHVQRENFDIADEIAAIAAERTDIGAVVTFTGVCRDEEGHLAALELEHYAGMAEAELARVAQEASGRWPGGRHGIHPMARSRRRENRPRGHGIRQPPRRLEAVISLDN